MPKGDPKRIQNAIDFQGSNAQNQLNNTRNNLIPQNQDLQNRAQVAYDQGNRDYSDIKTGYGNIINQANNPYSFGAYGNFQDFMNTGGLSDSDKAAMRARGEGAVRSVFDSSRRKLEQQNRIAGGSSTARTAALSKITRDTEHEVGDADINLEAQLADFVRQGKMFGMQGVNDIDKYRMGLGLQANQGLNQAYGTRPGMASMYGDLLNSSNGQMIQMQQLQQALAQMIMQAQQARGNMPTRWDAFKSATSGIKDIADTAGKLFA